MKTRSPKGMVAALLLLGVLGCATALGADPAGPAADQRLAQSFDAFFQRQVIDEFLLGKKKDQ